MEPITTLATTAAGTLLIKKLSDVGCGFFKPLQIKRIADAEADAMVTKAKGEIEVANLHERAKNRLLAEAMRQQGNIEGIFAKAEKELTNDSNPSAMENDWITNFFDKCRNVSDDEMQNLWSKILAGEANSPGTYSRRTVNFVSDMDKRDAELFTKLCSFCWTLGEGELLIPLILDLDHEIYQTNGIDHTSIEHLESIGLIRYVPMMSSTLTLNSGEMPLPLDYHKEVFLAEVSGEPPKINTGYVTLTERGHELAPISGSEKVDGFVDYVKENLSGGLRWCDRE